ncbi:MAG: flagellar biosynthesis anti-sigma factor FlgM [Desulfohalobiaceae bacterium]
MQINSLLAKLNTLNQEKIQGKDQNRAPAQQQDAGQVQDKVQLSSQAQALSQFQKGTEEGPEIRQEKVEEVKQLVQNGDYEPGSDRTAQALLKQELGICS